MVDVTTTEVPAKKEKTVPVLLKNDVWLEDGTRIRTNLPVLDQNGNPKLNEKREIITEQITVDLPISLAKLLISEGKAERRDPMPE